MGDPRKTRRKYRTPSHPWQKARLEEENRLAIDYGIKNKKQIWKMTSVLSNLKNQGKKLFALRSKQAEKEKANLIKRLKTLGLLKESQGFDDILNLTVKDVMERRLQTLVHRKGLAKTMKQARQFITHGNIVLGDKQITSPAYLVRAVEEPKIGFSTRSPFSSLDHPERKIEEKATAPKKKKAEPKEKKRAKPREERKEQKKAPLVEVEVEDESSEETEE